MAYTGQHRDSATDLQYHRARWLSTEKGRWLSEDPVFDFPGTLANLYSSGRISPLSLIDLSGTLTQAEVTSVGARIAELGSSSIPSMAAYGRLAATSIAVSTTSYTFSHIFWNTFLFLTSAAVSAAFALVVNLQATASSQPHKFVQDGLVRIQLRYASHQCVECVREMQTFLELQEEVEAFGVIYYYAKIGEVANDNIYVQTLLIESMKANGTFISDAPISGNGFHVAAWYRLRGAPQDGSQDIVVDNILPPLNENAWRRAYSVIPLHTLPPLETDIETASKSKVGKIEKISFPLFWHLYDKGRK